MARLKVFLGALATAAVFVATLMTPAGSQPADNPSDRGFDQMMAPGRSRPEQAVQRSGDDARACQAAQQGRWEEAEEHAASEGMRGLIRARRLPSACPEFTPAEQPQP